MGNPMPYTNIGGPRQVQNAAIQIHGHDTYPGFQNQNIMNNLNINSVASRSGYQPPPTKSNFEDYITRAFGSCITAKERFEMSKAMNAIPISQRNK